MKFILVIVFGLYLLMGSCRPADENRLLIHNTDFEEHLEAWNHRNIVDYQLSLSTYGQKVVAVVIVKNGIPVSSDPPEWLMSGEKSTIPEFFAFIKKEEKRLRDIWYRGVPPSIFSVRYEPSYHYPASISLSNYGEGYLWDITLISYISYDIGDYEEQLAAWNSKNMLDYQIRVEHWDSSYGYYGGIAEINVKNGIPVSSEPPSWIADGNISTIPEFYAHIKEEEKRIREEFDGTSFRSLAVRYAPEHYPRQIFLSANVITESWEITLK